MNGVHRVVAIMVLIEKLGDDLGDEYVVINIGKDVRFADEIKQKTGKMDSFKIKAWGKSISLGVRLANDAVSQDFPAFKIGAVCIGTEPGVEIPDRPGENDVDAGENTSHQECAKPEKRITRAISWIEIQLEKK
jgi:DNA-binding protein